MTGNVARDALILVFVAYVRARGMTSEDTDGVRRLLEETRDQTDEQTIIRGLRGELAPAHPFYSIDRARLWIERTGLRVALIITPDSVHCVQKENEDGAITLNDIPPRLILATLRGLPSLGPEGEPAWAAAPGAGERVRPERVMPEGWRFTRRRLTDKNTVRVLDLTPRAEPPAERRSRKPLTPRSKT